MNCPYCGVEMEQGLIQSNHAVSWNKGTKRRMFTPAFSSDVTLSELSLTKGSAVIAYNCGACRKVIIDYADPESDLNKRR
ncbi:MAG: hypothetical protein J6X60_08370 [Ruminiclostridium sp.]|nr:hypothetical protein [Ruminiclostridium sp.]